jgi:multiple sugar transport system substrate-binding protein
MKKILTCVLIITIALTAFAEGKQEKAAAAPEKVTLTVWSRWSGDEFNVFKAITDAYDAANENVTIELTSVSELDTKFLTAAAGGTPPDLVHTMSHGVSTWAEKNGIQSIDDITQYGVDLSIFVDKFLEMGKSKGKLYSLPITPGVVALYWNKTLYKEAGLDPEKPPKTIAELNEYIKKLTKYDDAGEIVQLGLDPLTPGWWPAAWCYFFGGKLYDPATNKITANDPGNIAAYNWLRDFTKTYGMEKLQAFRAGFGPYWSAENCFVTGKVAMSYDGNWKANMINSFKADLNWGVTPFPSIDGKQRAYIEGDYLSIPTGIKYPKEAKKLLAYLVKPENLEQLNIGQWKIPALKTLGESFYANHPNKNVKAFSDILQKSELFTWPAISVWNYYGSLFWDIAIPKVTLLEDTPENVFNEMQIDLERKHK